MITIPVYGHPITLEFLLNRDRYSPLYMQDAVTFLGAHFIAEFYTDSMTPDIRHGDRVAIQEMSQDPGISFNGTYYIQWSGGFSCGVIKANVEEPEIIVQPVNADNTSISRDQIKGIWQVKGILKVF